MKVCVYCSGAENLDQDFLDLGYRLGELIARSNYKMVYGGGKFGLMGEVASSVVKNSGYVIGVQPILLKEKEGHLESIQEIHTVKTMHERKALMDKLSDAFIILPGGFGTLDELFETVVLRQLNVHQKPIILLNFKNYWDPLIELFNFVINQGLAKKEHSSILQVVKNEVEAMEVLHSKFC